MTKMVDRPENGTEAATLTARGLTRDVLLGGRVTLLQPKGGFRATTDPVFLAAALPARPGESVLELGCGLGTSSLCLLSRVPGVKVTAVEIQTDYAALARENAALNRLPLEVVDGDVADLPEAVRRRQFDHVMANPPWFPPKGGKAAARADREKALREETPLALWIDVMLRRLRSGGHLALIQRTERLPEVLAALEGRLGAVRVLPLAGRVGRPAERFVLLGRKDMRTPFTLLPPFILHEGPRHLADRDDFTAKARAILREGAALEL